MNEEQKPINLNTLLAFVALIAMVVLLPAYWEWIGFTTAEKPDAVPVDTTRVVAPPAEFPADFDTQEPATLSEREITTQDTATGLFLREPSWTEEHLTVTTPHLEAVFSTRGARLVRLVLRDYQYNDDARRGQPIVLLDSTDDAGPRFRFYQDAVDLTQAPFVVDRGSFTLTAGDSTDIRFTVPTRDGSEWTVTYTFVADRYDFRTRLTIPDPWQAGLERELHFGWTGGLSPTEPDAEEDNGNFAAVALMGRDLETIGDIDDAGRDFSGLTHWAAVRTKYFVCATIPEETGAGFRVEGREEPLRFEGETIQLKQFSAYVRTELRAGAPIDVSYRLYTGPIDYDALKEYGVGLEEMVDLGWRWVVRPFSLVILWLFQTLHSVIPNYGLVIIVFSLLIKAVFHPLTKKQMRSMRRMQDMQPRLAKLKERFGKDPQRMNKETMKLYRDAGINPLGGCLPLLPQMPIFYALFQVFRTSIELRGAYFFGWLTDLSQKDPYYILPIIMALSMFVQQKLTMKDPKQKMLVYMMPLLFGFLFKDFPAGLTLYWTCYNISSVIEQTWLIGHPSPEEPKAEGEVGSGKVEKSKPARRSRKRK